jgi:hypothetical protein
MMQLRSHVRMESWRARLGASAIALAAFAASSGWADDGGTASPIKHIIVLIGENRTFDSVFATYKAKYGESVGNLLSRGIIKADGSPGPNFTDAMQYQLNTPLPATYFMGTGFTKRPIRRSCRHRSGRRSQSANQPGGPRRESVGLPQRSLSLCRDLARRQFRLQRDGLLQRSARRCAGDEEAQR